MERTGESGPEFLRNHRARPECLLRQRGGTAALGYVLAMLRKHGRRGDDVTDESPEPHLLLAMRPTKRTSQLTADAAMRP